MVAAARAVPCPFGRTVEVRAWSATIEPDAAEPAASAAHPLADNAYGVLIALPPTPSDSEQDLRAGVTWFLGRLTGRSRPFLDAQEWWVRAADGRDWFVTVHSPLYPPEHSRHWPLPRPAVLLVPKRAIDELFPAGIPIDVRKMVRSAFGRAGQRYPVVPGAVASVFHD